MDLVEGVVVRDVVHVVFVVMGLVHLFELVLDIGRRNQSKTLLLSQPLLKLILVKLQMLRNPLVLESIVRIRIVNPVLKEGPYFALFLHGVPYKLRKSSQVSPSNVVQRLGSLLKYPYCRIALVFLLQP